jgi:hypothetical protein
MLDVRTIFADGILDASVTHGVARLTLAQTGPEGKPLPAGQLVMPLSQLPAFTNGLVGLLKQIEAKVKEAQAQQQPGAGPAAPAVANGAEPPPSVPGAFRFS